MATQKAGTILINLKTKKIALVYNKTDNTYSFPKGHLEEGETLQECAIRETEEETMRSNHLLYEKEIDIIKYTTPLGENVENHIFISIDDGPTSKTISDEDKEIFKWFYFDEIENKLGFENLKIFWKNNLDKIKKIIR